MQSEAQTRTEQIGCGENNWAAATNCIMCLLLRAGVLLDASGAIEDRIGKEARPISGLADDFRLIADAYAAEVMVASKPGFNYDNDSYYIALVLYGQGGDNRLPGHELRAKADVLLDYLQQVHRIVMEGDRTIRLAKKPPVSVVSTVTATLQASPIPR